MKFSDLIIADDYEVLPGIRTISIHDMDPEYVADFYAHPERVDDRVRALAQEISVSGELNPLIMVYDGQSPYPYVLEGSHRIGAILLLKKQAFPAMVVVDMDA